MHYPGIKLNWLDVSRHCPCYRHSSVKTAYLLIASSRQSLQYLWPHLVRTGSRKGRWQIRQWKSSSTAEINSYSYPEGKGSRGTISPSAIVLQVPILKQEREPWERGIDRLHLPHPTNPDPTSTRSCKPGWNFTFKRPNSNSNSNRIISKGYIPSQQMCRCACAYIKNTIMSRVLSQKRWHKTTFLKASTDCFSMALFDLFGKQFQSLIVRAIKLWWYLFVFAPSWMNFLGWNCLLPCRLLNNM